MIHEFIPFETKGVHVNIAIVINAILLHSVLI